jgi:8-oxo-dGTP pyrophosphatase MutT (NUDIX family)
MAFVDWIHRCNAGDLTGFRPFLCAGEHIGWVHDSRLPLLAAHPGVFQADGDAIRLHPALETPQERTAALAMVTELWVANGILPGWRGEHYRAATALDAPELFAVERSAAPLFGLRAWGVHVNGFVRRSDGLHMWVARRASDRPVAPGKWDHVIAGGLPAGMTPEENLIKEADEEAGLPAEVAARAVAAGHVSYCFVDRTHCLRPDTLLVYDLELPDGMEPRNRDGEVERFELWPIERVAETVRDTLAFKRNCNLVIVDFLVRHGVIGPDAPDYRAIVEGLRRPFPALEAVSGAAGG